MLKVGNLVSFLDEKGGGKIVKIKDGLVYVEIEDGLVVPTPESNCIINDADDEKFYREADATVKKADLSPHCHENNGEPLIVDLHSRKRKENDCEGPNIIEEQLDYFHLVMRQNIRHRGRVIIFIHGKGEGILRSRLRTELRECYPQCTFEDAPFFSHGINGATKVVIR